jgi:hypothetical protein
MNIGMITATNALPNLYLFGIPGKIGGASTKIAHLLKLDGRGRDRFICRRNSLWTLDLAGTVGEPGGAGPACYSACPPQQVSGPEGLIMN